MSRITPGLLACLLMPATLHSAELPNIVVIMADDLGWWDLHCQGNDSLDTPAIDRLAEQGMRFTSAYAAAPVCTPTRAAMMTGLSPARLQITNHAPGHRDGYVPKDKSLASARWTRHLSLDHVTIAERLRDAGYATGFVGKWHLSHRPGSDQQGRFEPRLRPEHQGFDLNVGGCDRGGPPSYFEPYRIPAITPRKKGDYLPERLADECIEFIRDSKSDPFFLCWWNYSVHYPIEAPESLIEKYKQRDHVRRPAYAAMIEGMDRSIGRVLKELDDLQLSRTTVVLFKSDNGSLFENGPLRANKGYLYEGGIRVPWIIRWPGLTKPGSICDEPVISMDAHATVLDAARIAPDRRSDGESLQPLLTGKGKLRRKSIYFHYPNYAFHSGNRLGSAIRQGDEKLILFYDNMSIELYDLGSDLGESKNLADARPQRAAELKNELIGWLRETGAQLPEGVSLPE